MKPFSRIPLGVSAIAVLVAVGAMSILALGIAKSTQSSLSVSAKLTKMAKAHWAAETATESAFFELSRHERGFEATKALAAGVASTQNGWEISSRSNLLPPAGQGNSPLNADWNRIAKGDSVVFRLYYDNASAETDSTKTDIETLTTMPTIKVRVPPKAANGSDYSNVETSFSWALSNGTKSIYNLITDENITTGGSDLISGTTTGSDNTTTIANWLDTNNSTNTNTLLTFTFQVTEDLVDSADNSVPFLEYQVQFANGVTAPKEWATLSATGEFFGIQKTMSRTVPHSKTISIFNYAVFQ